MQPIRLIRGFLSVGAWTLASRLVGFIRDVMIAAYLGTGPVAQAYIVAFTLPNMFRRFFAEGAFNTAFVPMFAKRLEAGDDPRGFAEQAFSGLFSVVLVFSLIAHFAMPWLVLAMAAGFKGDERFDLAVLYGRICFPYILFISLTALLSGLLNAGGRFIAAAAAPVLMNFILIAAMLMADRFGWDMGMAMAWSTPISGIAQLFCVWWAAKRMGFPLRLRRPRLSPEMRRLLAVAAPAVMAGGVVQINLLVGRQVGSFFDGAIAWLTNADRLYQLPLGVVGIIYEARPNVTVDAAGLGLKSGNAVILRGGSAAAWARRSSTIACQDSGVAFEESMSGSSVDIVMFEASSMPSAWRPAHFSACSRRTLRSWVQPGASGPQGCSVSARAKQSSAAAARPCTSWSLPSWYQR